MESELNLTNRISEFIIATLDYSKRLVMSFQDYHVSSMLSRATADLTNFKTLVFTSLLMIVVIFWRSRKQKVYQYDATVSGMLAGGVSINLKDIENSQKLLRKHHDEFVGFDSAIDLAGGIGRVASNVLIGWFTHVDVQDLNCKYLREFSQQKVISSRTSTICCDIKDFSFRKTYDCIWIQWGLCWFEDDEELIQFLKNANAALKRDVKKKTQAKPPKTGLMVIKENTDLKSNTQDKFTYGKTRSRSALVSLFKLSDFRIISEKAEKHSGFGMIRCFVLKPKCKTIV